MVIALAAIHGTPDYLAAILRTALGGLRPAAD
jgi:hypothetical protein